MAGVAVSCGGGGGGGGGAPAPFSELVAAEAEPNDTPAGAVSLLVGQPGSGSLTTPGDVDWWRVELARSQVVHLEVFGARFDQTQWDAPQVKSIPKVDVFYPDGTTLWRSHDYVPGSASGSPSFPHKAQDLDFSFLRVPLDGEYLIRVQAIASAGVGGDYVVRFRKTNPGASTLELENLGAIGLNDSASNAQPITPGAMFGALSTGDVDVYSFSVSSPTLVSLDLHAERGGMLGGAGGYVDAQIRLLDVDGVTPLMCSDNVHFADPRLEFSLSTPGVYFAEISQPRVPFSGEYMLAYSTSSSASSLSEVEPNNAPAQAQPLTLGSYVAGAVAPGDADVFAFQATAGDMLEVQVFDGSNAQDRTGFVVPELLRADGITQLPAGGYWSAQKLTAIVSETGTHYLVFTDDGSLATYRARVRVVRSAPFEVEPNNVPAVAGVIAPGGRMCGVISDDRDIDFIRFDAEADKLVVLQCYAGWFINGGSGDRGTWGSAMSPLLKIVDPANTAVVFAEVSGDANFANPEGVAEYEPVVSLAFTPTVTGSYYLSVEDARFAFGPKHVYVVEMR